MSLTLSAAQSANSRLTCTRRNSTALRTINKIGLNAALKKAEAEGNLDFRNINILSL